MVKLLVKSTWLSRGASRWFGDFLPNSRGYLFRLALENHEIISLNNRNMDGHHLQLLFSIDMFIDRTALILAIFLLPTSALRSRSLHAGPSKHQQLQARIVLTSPRGGNLQIIQI
jgi:hypothetical protein